MSEEQQGQAAAGDGTGRSELRSGTNAAAPAPPVVAPVGQGPALQERALQELDRLAERDLAEHPDVYQRIHSELQSALASIDNT